MLNGVPTILLLTLMNAQLQHCLVIKQFTFLTLQVDSDFIPSHFMCYSGIKVLLIWCYGYNSMHNETINIFPAHGTGSTSLYSTCLLLLCFWYMVLFWVLTLLRSQACWGNFISWVENIADNVTTADLSYRLNSEIFPNHYLSLSAVCLAAFRFIWTKMCLLVVTKSQIQRSKTSLLRYHPLFFHVSAVSCRVALPKMVLYMQY